MREKLRTHWFIVSLLIVLVGSRLFGDWLAPIAEADGLRTAIVLVVLFLMALPVPLKRIGESLVRPWPSLLAIALNIGLLPLIAWGVSQWLDAELRIGLLVASVIPTTLASAAVMARRAQGSDTIPILVTLATTGTCFLVAPAWLYVMISKSVTINGPKMAMDLAFTVVMPIALAQLLALDRRVFDFATARKETLGFLCQCGILTMVAIGSIRMGQGGEGEGTRWDQIAIMIAIAAVLHSFILGLGWWMAGLFRWSREDQIGVSLAGSQKTLLIGLKIAVDCGGSIVPILMYHLVQLFIDAALVERWRGAEKTKMLEADRREPTGEAR